MRNGRVVDSGRGVPRQRDGMRVRRGRRGSEKGKIVPQGGKESYKSAMESAWGREDRCREEKQGGSRVRGDEGGDPRE